MKSRKLSTISTQLPKCPAFFVDRSCGSKKLIAELRALGFDVKAHDDHFKKAEKDEIWLLKVGAKNWRVLTSDQELETLHREEIVQGNVGVFILSDLRRGDTSHHWINMIHTCRDQIRHAATRADRPFVARISREGKLYQIRHIRAHAKTMDITDAIELDAAIYGITSRSKS